MRYVAARSFRKPLFHGRPNGPPNRPGEGRSAHDRQPLPRPYPRTSSRTTLAPSDAATSLVRSVELLSTTPTSSTKSGIARRTFSIPCSSLRQGMITVIDRDLYMEPTFSACPASGYHEVYEAGCAIPMLLRHVGLRHRFGHREERVRAPHGEGHGPVSGKPHHQRAPLPDCHRSPEGGRDFDRPDRRRLRIQTQRAVPAASAAGTRGTRGKARKAGKGRQGR